MKKILSIIIAVGMLIALIGCGYSNEKFLGTWIVVSATYTDVEGNITNLEAIDGIATNGSTFEFDDDCTVTDGYYGTETIYEYSVNAAELEFETFNGSTAFNYSFVGDSLVLTMSKVQSSVNGVSSSDCYEVILVKQ